MTQDAQQLDHRLVDHLYGELDAAERQRVERELDAQPELRAMLEGWQRVRTAFATTDAAVDPAPAIADRVLDAARQRAAGGWRVARTGTRGSYLLLPWALPLAASVLVVFGVTMHVLQRDRGPTGDAEEIAVTKPSSQPGRDFSPRLRSVERGRGSLASQDEEKAVISLRAVAADEQGTRERGETEARRRAALREARDQWVDGRLLGREAQDPEGDRLAYRFSRTTRASRGGGGAGVGSLGPARIGRSAPRPQRNAASGIASRPSAPKESELDDRVALARSDQPYAEEEPPAAEAAAVEGDEASGEAPAEAAGAPAPSADYDRTSSLAQTPATARARRPYAAPPPQASPVTAAAKANADCDTLLAAAERQLRERAPRDRPLAGSRLVRALGGRTLGGCGIELQRQRGRYPLLFAAWRAAQ
ncbi:MAG: hypothetical protein IPG96_01900 [Proteobacteria bacterium]|nr:hypothetical protein [Pseudomonadota bacterium]